MRLALTPESVYQVVSDPDYTVNDGGFSDRSCTARGIARRMGYDEMDPQVHALIRSMRVAGFIAQNALGGYNIGPAPLPAGQRAVPAQRQGQAVRPALTLTDRFGRVWTYQGSEIYLHDKMAWLGDRVTDPSMRLPSQEVQQDPNYQWCDYCLRLFAAAGPSGVVPGTGDDDGETLADIRAGTCTYNRLEVGRQHVFTNVRPPDGQESWDVCGQPLSNRVHRAAGPSGVPFADEGTRNADRALLERLEASAAAGNFTSHEPGDACELGLWHEGPCPDAKLERQLALDDKAEDRGMDRDDLDTCGVHRKWSWECVRTSPDHANPITKYNWCKLHSEPVQRCGCWTANLSGHPMTGDEPQYTAEDWVDWMADPRIRSEGLRGGLGVDTHRGYFRVLPHPDGTWRVEGPYGHLSYHETRHLGLLSAVDNDVHPQAVRRPRRRPAPSGVPQGVVE